MNGPEKVKNKHVMWNELNNCLRDNLVTISFLFYLNSEAKFELVVFMYGVGTICTI